MRNPSKIIIDINENLETALKKLERTQEKLLICVNKKKFVGVINDGDIRRAVLKKAKLKDKIDKYVNKNATVVTNQITESEATKLINTKIMILPVVDSKNNVRGFYSFKGKDADFSLLSQEITVVGMGYVGLTLSAVLSEVGFKVIGFDNNISTINALKRKKVPFYEKGLRKYLYQNTNKQIFFVNKLKKNKSSIYVIAVGTPINSNKKPDLNNIKKAVKDVARNIEKNDLIILRSTLPVGTTRKTIIPILEKYSKKRCGLDFSVSFAPERTAEGIALKELKENPQIIGGFDEKSSEKTANFFNYFTNSLVHVSSLEAAEFCKLIDNAYRDHRFAFINQFIKFSEKNNLNLKKIVNAVNYGYSRNDIPVPSPGVGGPCLTKDPHILSYNLEKNNIDSSLIKLSRTKNEIIVKDLFYKIKKNLKIIKKNKKNIKIFILGMSFKGSPETSDLRNSSSLDLIHKLKNFYKNIYVYDPLVKYNYEEIKQLKVKNARINQGFQNADLAIIMNNNRIFNDLNIFDCLNKMNKPSIFIDAWQIYDPLEIKQIKGITYLGVGND